MPLLLKIREAAERMVELGATGAIQLETRQDGANTRHRVHR